MDCQVCSEEIPDDSLFCPECGARQDPSKSGAMGGRNFGVVSSQAVQATHDMQASDSAGGSGVPIDPSNFLNQIAGQMDRVQAQQPVQEPTHQSPMTPSSSVTDQVVDQIVESERAEKAGARNEWLAMNQKTASGVLAGLSGGEVPEHLASASGSARFLDDGQDVGLEKKRVKSNQPSPSLLRRMAEVATRRVARKRGVAVESPQVAMTEDDTVQVNVTYIDDGRVLDTPPDLSNAFEHAIATELALKGFDIGIEIALFRSLDGSIELVWGEAAGSEEIDEDDEDLFACDDCGYYPIRDSDSSCPGCGAQFIDDDDDDDWDDSPTPPSSGPSTPPSRGSGGPPSRGPSGGPGGPPRGPSRGSGGPPRGPSRGPGGSPPSRGPGGGPPSRGPGGGPPSRGPSGGPPSRGPGGGPPSRGPGGGGPPSRGPGGGPPKKKRGPPN